MFSGGATINRQTDLIIRVAGLLVPIVLVGYGLLIQFGALESTSFVSPEWFYVLMAAWILLGMYQVGKPVTTKATAVWRMSAYHIFAALYVLFVSGFSMPFIAGWILLFIANYAFFSGIGVRYSLVSLLLVAAIDIILHSESMTIVLNDITAVISVVVVGLIVTSIGKVQEVDGKELTRSKAEESLQRDRILTLINNLTDAVLSIDKDGIVRVYNAASLNLLDTNTSLNGHHIDEVLELHDDKDTPISLLDTAKTHHRALTRDDLYRTSGNETIRLEVTLSPIRGSFSPSDSERQDGYIVIMRDVTKAKSLEEERDEFISVVSHELRTPITVAEGTISNVKLMMEREGIPKQRLEEGVATAHEQVLFLAKMVNDLSTLSRAERGVADAPEEIEVRQLINDLYNEYAPQADKKDLQFDLDLSPHLGRVTASPLYLKELLQNFITNAIKYTPKGSVTLRANNTDGKLTFAVRDTGIGIGKSEQKKIFDKFYRSEDYRTRETGGTGLGLYVAAKLAKKLGTSIKLQSRLNHGSTFQFSLPTTRSHEEASHTRSRVA